MVVGHGKLVGRPVQKILEIFGGQPEILHRQNFEEGKDKLKEADLIVSGAGRPNLIRPEMIKEGVFLIDAGTSTHAKTIRGDIDLTCSEKAGYFAKVPGGVGPLTTIAIFDNLRKLLER